MGFHRLYYRPPSSVHFSCSTAPPFLHPDLRVFDGVVSQVLSRLARFGPPEGLGLETRRARCTLRQAYAGWDVASDIFLTSKLRP